MENPKHILQKFLDGELAIEVRNREEYDDFLDTMISNNIRANTMELWKQFHYYNDCPEYHYLLNNTISSMTDPDKLRMPYAKYKDLKAELEGMKNMILQPENKTPKEEDEKESEKEPSFGEKYYDAVDEKHRDILAQCAVPCYSNKKGFTDTTRIDAIRKLLKKSGYREIYLNTVSLWHKGDLAKQAEKECVLVSSHCDLVKNITSPFSKLSDDGYYKGTYDNIGTNAAAVITMLESDLPSNVIFAFTSEEESGKCLGAKDAVSFLNSMKINKLTCIALDVTYEGYDEGMLASVENGTKDTDFLHKITKAAMSTESGRQSFCFVRKSKRAVPDNLPKEYLCKDTGMYDEAFAYGDINQNSFSLCLPCDGNMHSNVGVTVRQPVFEGYIDTLKGMLYSLTKTHVNQLATIQIEKNTLLDRTAELVEKEKALKKSRINEYYFGSHSEDYHEYYQYGLQDYIEMDDAYEEIIEETVVNNIEAYAEDEKNMFIDDCISMIDPDVHQIYHTLYEKIGQQWEDYQAYLHGEYEDGFGDPYENEGYIDPEDFVIE